jgi:hypothetical protein
MESPQNHIWGPAFWVILHSCAERIGSIRLNRLPDEESRIWLKLLQSLRYSLPCPACKQHYALYIKSHPIGHSIREWLFHLHQDVNARTNKSTEWTLEQMSERYTQPFFFSEMYRLVERQLLLSIPLKISTREDVYRTLRSLNEMRRFYLL